MVMHLAEQLDLALRADNSNIKESIVGELCELYNVTDLLLETTELLIPIEQILESKLSQTSERMWHNTEWTRVSYPTERHDAAIPDIGGMYANYSKEIQASPFHREGTYQFAHTLSWRAVALQILKHISWNSECSQSWNVSIDKLLPPQAIDRKLFPGLHHEEIPDWKPGVFSFDEHDKKIEIFATPTVIDTLGMVICILRYDNRPIERKLKVCGEVITKEPPQYMDEYALQWAMELFREHIEKGTTPQRLLHKPTICAGSINLVYELRSWHETGNLQLKSAAAPGLIREYGKLEALMETPVAIGPNQINDATENLQLLPAVQQGLLKAAEEFRVIALTLLGGDDWIRRLP